MGALASVRPRLGISEPSQKAILHINITTKIKKIVIRKDDFFLVNRHRRAISPCLVYCSENEA